jgi:opacity protein-like surface antigen
MEDYLKKTAIILAAIALGSAAFRADAQQGRFELTPMIGYRLNSDINETDVAKYSQLRFEDAATFGIAATWNTSPFTSVEIEYTYSSYDATAVPRSTGTAQRTVNVAQHNVLFNGLYLFNTGNPRFQPFILGGVGAAILAPDGNLDSVTNFAFTLGGGVKYYASDRVGIRGDIRWMPQYLYSTDGGTWCDPFYGCYYYPNDHIISQWDFKLGVIIRF